MGFNKKNKREERKQAALYRALKSTGRVVWNPEPQRESVKETVRSERPEDYVV